MPSPPGSGPSVTVVVTLWTSEHKPAKLLVRRAKQTNEATLHTTPRLRGHTGRRSRPQSSTGPGEDAAGWDITNRFERPGRSATPEAPPSSSPP